MPYPEQIIAPMRAELTRLGVKELIDSAAVDASFSEAADDTMLLVVNSVCGCAAANARPAVAMARQHPTQPDHWVTVFAGQDLEATAKARTFLPGIPASSPFIALMKRGEPVFLLERRNIEGRSASAIAMDLTAAFDRYCGTEVMDPSEPGDSLPDAPPITDTFRSIL